MHASDHGSKLDLALILLFAGALLAPAIDTCIRDDSDRGPEEAEQRTAAPCPPTPSSLWTLLVYPDRYERYFRDTFGLRDVLLRWHSLEKLFVFRVSASRKVVVGRDDWMFYSDEFSLETFRGVHPFTNEELERWRRTLESQRDYLARRGIDDVFVIGPNKETIYPDYVPTAYNRVGPTRMDQLVAYLDAHSDFRILDLRPPLIAARADDRPYDHLYYELGTHWNGRGNFVAARETSRRLHARFPAVKEIERDAVQTFILDDHGDSEADWMYVGDFFPQRHIWLTPVGGRRARTLEQGWVRGSAHVAEMDDAALPRALVLHDSFGIGPESLLADSFRHSTWLQTPTFDTGAIAAEKPDVVIAVYVERILVGLQPEVVHDANH